MSTQREEAMVAMGELDGLLNHQIMLAALKGDSVRELDRYGRIDLVAGLVNEFEAHLYIKLINEFESLISGGMGTIAALNKLRREGWLDRIYHHTHRAQEQ